MSLHLSESRGIVSVRGVLNYQNIEILNRHIGRSFQPYQSISINLESVTEFDNSAAFSLLKMFIKSVHTKRSFSIIAMQNKKVLKVLKETETFAIWTSAKRIK